MTKEESRKMLIEYNKWRRAEGKYASIEGCPFEPSELGEAIDVAIESMSCQVTITKADLSAFNANEAGRRRSI